MLSLWHLVLQVKTRRIQVIGSVSLSLSLFLSPYPSPSIFLNLVVKPDSAWNLFSTVQLIRNILFKFILPQLSLNEDLFSLVLSPSLPLFLPISLSLYLGYSEGQRFWLCHNFGLLKTSYSLMGPIVRIYR